MTGAPARLAVLVRHNVVLRVRDPPPPENRPSTALTAAAVLTAITVAAATLACTRIARGLRPLRG